MRVFLLAVLLVLVAASSAFAQSEPAVRQLGVPYPAPTRPQLTAEQLAQLFAHVRKCLSARDPIQNPITLSVTIGPDGMISGDPEVDSPIDSDEFREDVKTVVKKLHQCEPLIVDPFGRIKGTFIQSFRFVP